MRTLRSIALWLTVLALLAGCSLLGQATPTQAPVIIIATSTPGGGAPAATRAPTAAPNVPTAANTAPTAAPNAPAPTVAPNSPSKGTVTFAFDAFPTYYPGIVMEVQGLLKQRGYELKLVPFGLDGANDVPEEQRWANLKSGEWDVLATTLDGFARQSDPAIGAITAVIDESAGADKLVAKPEITTINALKSQRIAFSQGSVGEYFLYYALSLAGLGPQDVQLVPQPAVADAVKAYTSGQADAVSAWVPDVQEAEAAGAKTIIASDKLRAILDVLISSRPAIENKTEALQAFHDAWYEALKQMTDTPDQAEQALLKWGHADWTFIEKPGDLRAALEPLAQATLNTNQIAFQQPQLLVSRLQQAQQVWARAGQTPPQADLNQMVDPRFTLGSSKAQQLFSNQPPVNSSFLLTAKVDLPQLSSEEQQNAQDVVKLPLEKIDFQPESARLTDQAVSDLNSQVLPVLRASQLYLKIEGSAAWPGPDGRFTEAQIQEVAQARADSVAQFLAQQGIDPNRLIVSTIPSKFPNSLNESELVQDRIVRFTLVTTGGR
ncbi:MAG: ABC transporter substrate-binding protein [Chloroflexi bacterium SZAS-1]|jgi:ABC-type nitrate/sulfonate/bicarbonate transport system substrate-binding protein|nr:ABC transporter substrate-binding protein [Chloroflexi bacterium SZAS-1]